MGGAESFCMLVSDAQGRVTFQMGELLQRGAGEQASERRFVGVKWREALVGLIEPELLPEKLPEKATSWAVRSMDGLRLGMHVARLPVACGKGSILLIQREGMAPSPRAQQLCALGMLAAGVAHEMNNLLTLVSGWLELGLAEVDEASERSQALKKVAEAVEQLSGLSQNLLDMSRAERGQLRPMDVNEAVERVIGLIDFQLAQSDIEFTRSLTQEAVLIRGDEGELCQAFLNLIMNAYQAMPSGGSLHVSTRQEDKWAVVEVKDTGCGIPPEIQERMFDPFFTTRRDEGGTGLGLPVCREIAERHGGEVGVRSHPGAGTTVSLRIPLLREGVGVADG